MTNTKYYIRYFFIRIFRLIAIFLGIILIISLFLFSTVDRPVISSTDDYQKTMAQLDSFQVSQSGNTGDTVKVGWGKSSITPDKPSAMAGYGARKEAVYQSIHDSIFVRAFVFEGPADLLIFPPKVIEKLAG